MARRRMIEVSISKDKDFNSLSEFAQLLYLKTLPHTDDFGRMEGDPETLKIIVDGFSKRKISDYERAIAEIASKNLWLWYETDEGKKIIQYSPIAFERINAFLIKKRGNPEYPEFNKDLYKSISVDIHIISNKYKAISKKIKDTEETISYKDGRLIIPNGIREEFNATFSRQRVDSEIPAMEKWLKFNKPKKDYKRFIFNWLNKPVQANTTIKPDPPMVRKVNKCISCFRPIPDSQTICEECETIKKDGKVVDVSELVNGLTKHFKGE